jgi:hypothetical protein
LRSAAGRRFKHLAATYTEELGGGQLSQSDQGLVRQAAAIRVHAERLQAAIVAGHDVDSDQVIRLSSECRRILGSLTAKGLKNKPETNTRNTLPNVLRARRMNQSPPTQHDRRIIQMRSGHPFSPSSITASSAYKSNGGHPNGAKHFRRPICR